MFARAIGVLLLSAAATGCAANAEPTGSTERPPQLIEPGTLTVCTSTPYEPFEFEQDGEIVGFDIDLADSVANRLGLRPVYLNEDFDAIASGELLNDGTCDVAVAGLTITGDRARAVDFSSPYFDAAQALVVPSSARLASLEELGGKRIAVQSGTTGETYLTDNAPSDAVIVPFDDPSEMADAVSSGEVAAAVYDNTVVGGMIAGHPRLEVAAEFNTGEQYGMAVKKNANVDLLRAINDELATLQAEGGYDAIYATWFGGD